MGDSPGGYAAEPSEISKNRVVQKQTSSASSSPQMQMQMKIMSVVMPLFIGWNMVKIG